jgi:hypothetical protein
MRLRVRSPYSRIAEAEATGAADEINDDDDDAALQPSVESQDDWCCMYWVLSLQEDFMYWVLSLQEDFRAEKSMLQTYIEEQGHICEFLLKFHRELAAIEMLWGFGKYRTSHSISHSILMHISNNLGFRQVADGKFVTAKELVLKCLDMADRITIWHFFRKTWRYMDAY